MFKRWSACFLLGTLIFLPLSRAHAEDVSVWDLPPMTADPTLVRAAVDQLPVMEDDEVRVLHEARRYIVDEEGKITFTWHFVYRIDGEGAIDSWSRVSSSWRPWYQSRPQIEARVIAADGTVYPIDSKNLGEYSADDDGPDVYGDVMTLRGPLPAVEVGAIVEEYHIVEETRPGFAAGVIRSAYLTRAVPVDRYRVEIEADERIPLNHILQQYDISALEKTTTDGVVHLSLDVGPVEPWEEDTAHAPGSIAREPVFRFSTGESWKAVASEYSRIVDEQIAGSDVAKLAREIAGEADDLEAILPPLLTYLRQNVRYTGIEFGEQSFVPSPPSETLDRKFGDCKDKATLLVAMLRSLDIEAHVALLNTGPSNDVDPELPGLGRFDHAIVNVPGDSEVWIDPTVEYARSNELPPWDRDRRALIADTKTTGLLSTPPGVSGENLRKEHREVNLARDGAAEIIESSTVSGWIERGYREGFSDKTETELQEQLESYVTGQYKAEALMDYEMSDIEDLSQHLQVRLVSSKCGTALTSASDASVAIELGSMVRDLPTELRPEDEGDEGDEDPEPRKYPLVLFNPVVVEITYRIVPPPGYSLTDLPDSGERTFGPGILTETYESGDDGVVTAELRFDSGKTTYTAAEVETTIEALGEFFKESKPIVAYENVGERFLEAGQIREALTQFQSLVDEYPDEAIYRTQVARAYLEAGLGGAARREAKRAVELAPESVVAHNNLGIILAHDELGRKFNPGFDPEGAEKAFRKAIELDPENYAAHGELAILLENDPDGNRYSEDARLDEAIVIYEKMRTDFGYENLTSNLMATQFYSDHFADLRELWKDAPRNTLRDALYLAATAAEVSAVEAIKEAARITSKPDSYRELLRSASDWLVRNRRYPEAAALVAAGSKGAEDSIQLLAHADLLNEITMYEEFAVDPTDPEGVVRNFFVSLITAEEADIETIRHLFHPDLLENADAEVVTEIVKTNGDFITGVIRTANVSDELVLDSALSLGALTSTGASPAGARIRFQPAGVNSSSAMTIDFYTLPSGDAHSLVGFAFSHSMIGEMLLGWVADGRAADVSRWLDWMIEELGQFGGNDVLDPSPLEWLWPPKGEADEALLERAAASLMIDGMYGDRPIEVLQRDREKVEDPDVTTGIDLALAIAGKAIEDWETALEASERLCEAHPRSMRAFSRRILALIRLERYSEADALILERLKRFPGDQKLQDMYCDQPQYTNELVEYRRRMEAAIKEGRASAGIYNNLAWLDIVEGKTTDATRQAATRSASMTDYSRPATLHTLATVYAELGMTTEARNVLLALLENHSSNDLEGPDWYILGRIAEHYGAPDAAIEMYRKVEKPEDWKPLGTSTFKLANTRIAALESTESP